MLRKGLTGFLAVPIVFGSMALAQQPTAPAAPGGSQGPLQLNSITPPKKVEFPPVDQKNFTAASPTAAEVNAFLKQLWGYDPNRVWEVAAVQKTKAPNLSRVVVLVAEQGVSRQPGETSFFVTPDGQHAISGTDVVDFGPHPFANIHNTLAQQANGPYTGSSSKKLMLVEFADMQCPHCKEAAPTMKQVATDFPNARIVFENFPLTNIHPAAEKAAEYGVCVAKEKGNAAFFQYLQAVYDNQSALMNAADETLKNAATKAGADPTTVATCAASPAAKAAVDASVQLGKDVGVSQTPTLFVNGRNIPIGGIPYATLKQIITYAAAQDNATSVASK